MLTPIRWGILGTSFISEVMANAIQEAGDSQVVAIGSRSADVGNAYARQFSIPKVYTDHQQLLNDPEIDAIYIGLPNHLHKEWIIRCAQAGKHILCEKPFTLSAQEAEEALTVVKQCGVFCMEALMYLYHPFTQQLQSILHNKTLGDVKLYNATYTANIAALANTTAGGSIRNLGCYPVSLIRLLANAEPIRILGQGRANDTANDRQASVILTFPDNAMAVISTADDLAMSWQLDIYGTEGSLSVVSNPWLPDREKNTIRIKRNQDDSPQDIHVSADKSLYCYQIEKMNNNIRNQHISAEDRQSWQFSRNNVAVLEAWHRQVMESQPLKSRMQTV